MSESVKYTEDWGGIMFSSFLVFAATISWLATSESTVCSWYGGPAFHGQPTASGDTFDMHGLTAASPDLPFGSVLMIEHGQYKVAVTVTDRGPFAVDSTGAAIWPLEPHPTRTLDLSFGAMKALGGVMAGVVPVEVWRLR